METMIRAGGTNLEEVLGAILRGAAKILGCSSTNLILFNERTQEIRVQIGTMAVSYPILEKIERVLGNSFNGISLPMQNAEDSLVYKAWRDQTIHETSSLSTLAGSAFQHQATEQMARLAGDLRFICVPAHSGTRNYGVLLFTKEGKHPFSLQQREVLLRYARRIGEMLKNDLMGQQQDLLTPAMAGGPEYLLFDSHGELQGKAPDVEITSDTLDGVRGRVLDFVDQGSPDGTRSQVKREPTSLNPDLRVELAPMSVMGTSCVLCAVHREVASSAVTSFENQLLQLTLGEAAPTLFLDPEFHITSCNSATEQLFGYRCGELRQHPVDMLFSEPREILEILSQQILYPATPYCEESAIILHKDGATTPARVEALVLADELHKVVGFLLLIRPGSAAEEDSATRLLVQERLATMGEMATQLAHEIRNPLVAIGATLESLGHDEMAEEQRTQLKAVTKEITRMDMILRDYLAVRHESSFAEVNVAEVVAEARPLLEGARKAEGKTISVEIPASLSIHADYDAIKHVFFNLLLNALEASPEGGEVTCRASAGERDVTVTIEDRGPGPGANPGECFQPFFTTKKNGTGLGLPVCQKIARAHGGLVALRNREGGGCQAVVLLPHRAQKPRSDG
jgi:PAS domain S-box-containing protein